MTGRESGVQTVRRALELIDIIAESREPIAVSVLAEAAGVPAPTVYRLLRTLIAAGYVRQLPSRRYVLGVHLMRLGKIAGASLDRNVEPYLHRLVSATGETSNFAMLDGDMIVYVAQAPSPHSMRMFTEIGRRVYPHSTGVGKAILSLMSKGQVIQLLNRTGLPALTDRTHTSVAEILDDLQLIRERGWAEDDGEQEIGVRCMAVPIRMADFPAAISISGPTARVTHQSMESFAPILGDVAENLAEALRSDSSL